jgi:hypothetical protein
VDDQSDFFFHQAKPKSGQQPRPIFYDNRNISGRWVNVKRNVLTHRHHPFFVGYEPMFLPCRRGNAARCGRKTIARLATNNLAARRVRHLAQSYKKVDIFELYEAVCYGDRGWKWARWFDRRLGNVDLQARSKCGHGREKANHGNNEANKSGKTFPAS